MAEAAVVAAVAKEEAKEAETLTPFLDAARAFQSASPELVRPAEAAMVEGRQTDFTPAQIETMHMCAEQMK
jgi:hypothetical protein